MRKSKRLVIILLAASMPASTSLPAKAGQKPMTAIKQEVMKDGQAVNAELEEAMEVVTVKNKDNIKGNISLPAQGLHGTTFTWKSDNEQVVNTKERKNQDYFSRPGGTVTRQNDDEKVILTATGELNGETASKDITVTVRKKTEKKDFTGYLYAYFSRDKNNTDHQQIHFAISKDGITWSDLNEDKPVLTSEMGDHGVRDPYIIRSAEGDKFYLIATDLDIYSSKYGGNWGKMSTEGSQDLVIWESEDLVNWSKQRNINVSSGIEAGDTWAPEAIYDEKTGEYLVYWSSRVKEDNYAKHRIYVCRTRDFYTFTKPEVYSDEPNGNIDASIFKVGDSYYRLIKDDKVGNVKLERADTLLNYQDNFNRGSHFKHVKNNELEGYKGGYEGATMFQFINQKKWCVLVDEYVGKNRGYIPFLSEDITEENSLKMMDDESYIMPTGAKHGTVIPVTREEYEALADKWLVKAKDKKEIIQEAPVLQYDFEQKGADKEVKDTTGKGHDGKFKGNASYIKDEQKGQVLYLDGTEGTYVEMPQGFFDGRNRVTVSMDIKPQTEKDYFFTFAMGQDSDKYMFLRIKKNNLRNAVTTLSSRLERDISVDGDYLNQWINVKIVMDGHKMTLYRDGKQIGVNNYVRSVGDIGSNLKAFLGKSFYNDPYFKGSFDNIQVYNRALTEKDVESEMKQKELKKTTTDILSGLEKQKYTSDTFDRLEDAAGKINALDYASEKDTKACEYAFRQARNGLRLREDAAAAEDLKRVLQKAENIRQYGYTKDSYDKLKKALGDARAVQADIVKKEEAEVLIKNIEAAVKGLKKVETQGVSGVRSSGNKAVSLKLSWKKAKNCTGYEVYRFNCSKKAYVKIKNVSFPWYQDQGLKSGTTYTYRIRSYKKDGGYTYFGKIKTFKTATAPGKVSRFKVKKVSRSKVKVSWKKVRGASGYAVYLKTGKGKYKKIKTVTKGSFVKIIKTKLKKGRKYTFKIQAYKKADRTIYGTFSLPKTIRLK